MRRPIVTFLSDYGVADEFVGICHGVIAMICPEAQVIDLTHGVARHDVRAGALILRGALPYVPARAVYLAVVDPDVGARRRAVALGAADGRRFVGPDNGLLWLAAEASGGVVEAAEISRSPLRLEPVSATFHGRDVFAPVAAHLAAGAAVAEVGDPCDPGELVRLELPAARFDDDGGIVARAVYIDRFGNVQLNVEHEELTGGVLKLGHAVQVGVSSGATERAAFVRTFADVEPGGLLLYEDAARRLALAVSHGDAAGRLGIAVDDRVWIKRA
jgi:S-adenosylmethionine hydrolase